MIEYIENPDRALYLTSEVNVELFNTLLPKILEYRARSGDPICLYIDSYGGIVRYAEKLHEIIKAPLQNGGACRLITIVPSLAASAAADLLILSDYAIAYPSALIWCHGTRVGSEGVTMDNIKDYEKNLKQANRTHALKLAKAVCGRLIQRLHIESLQQESDEISAALIRGAEIINYFKSLGDITENTRAFIGDVIETWEAKEALFSEVIPKPDAKAGEVIRAIVERHTTDLDEQQDLGEVAEAIGVDISLLNEYVEGYIIDSPVTDLSHQFGELLVTEDEQSKLDAIEDSDAKKEAFDGLVDERVRKIWAFSLHLCHRLHLGENRFYAVEAYGLGLIDEIVGMTDQYPSTRILHQWAQAAEAEAVAAEAE